MCRVGTNLGAGDAWRARLSAFVVLAGSPLFWAVGALLLLLPPTQTVGPGSATALCQTS